MKANHAESPQKDPCGHIPAEAKPLLLKAIANFSAAKTLLAELRDLGIRKSERTVMVWLRITRQSLGFPPHYPCTSSETYRGIVRDWIASTSLTSSH